MTVTLAPMPIAMRAALVPATPPPRITTLARRHAGHAAEQHARAALLLLQAMRADLHRHAPRDLAHRRQQRQRAARVGDGLVGDAGGARAHQPLGLRAVGGEMQIGEQHLPRAQQRDLRGCGSFTFTTISAAANTSSAVAAIVAPAAR